LPTHGPERSGQEGLAGIGLTAAGAAARPLMAADKA